MYILPIEVFGATGIILSWDVNNQGEAPPPGTDGWLDAPLPPVEHPPSAPLARRESQPRPTGSSELLDEVDSGRAIAIFCHASILFGLPVFLIPMVTLDNRFALHHGKAAAVNFGFFMLAIGLTTVSCGLLFPLLLLCYVPALVGVVQAANGQLAGSLAWGNLGESVFKNVTVKEEPPQLP